MRGIFLGKSYGNMERKEKKKRSLNSKSMFHSVSSPLCVCECILRVELLSRTQKPLCFSSLIIRRAGSLESGLPVHTGVRQGEGDGQGGRGERER